MRKRSGAGAVGAAALEGIGGMWNPGDWRGKQEKEKSKKENIWEKWEFLKLFNRRKHCISNGFKEIGYVTAKEA